ncbi:hypothetical protein ACFO3J_00570 [Streptomyces polygonati]|uniref:Uncharacterized protein n=1 Tax=Streptomyces polygonati TaxID=1617087 RepID=A0ABV8HD35_9ACTN
MTQENAAPAEALHRAERLSEQVYRKLRAGLRVDAEAVELACLLLDWGHTADIVRELVVRRPADIPEAEMAELAAKLLRAVAFDPGFALAPGRLPVLEEAVRGVAADFAGSGVVDGLHIVLSTDGGPRALLALGDGTLLSSGNGLAPSAGDDPVRALVEVAEEVQAEVADRFRLVWPVCDRHGLGLRPVAEAAAAHWRCGGGPAAHFEGPVGGLTAVQQRR